MAPEVLRYDFAAGSPAVRIEQDQGWAQKEAALAEACTGLTQVGPAFGLIPWASSQVVCRLLALGLLGPLPSEDATVVEVGAGLGLPGLLAAAQRKRHRSCEAGSNGSDGGSCPPGATGPPLQPAAPARFLLTDYHPQVLEALRKNVALNGFDAADVEVAALDFRAPGDCKALVGRGPVDWVIATDVAYDDRLLHDMLHTFDLLCRLGREPQSSPADAAGAGTPQNDAASSDQQNDDVPAEAPPRRPPCRILLASESRARDAGVRLLREAREAGFKVEGPISLPSEAFRWGVAREKKPEDADGRPAAMELERVRPEVYGVVVLSLAEQHLPPNVGLT